MASIDAKNVLDSLPTLQVIHGADGLYIDFFGGNDTSSFDMAAQLQGKRLEDFFNKDQAEHILKHINIALKYQTVVDVDYYFCHDRPSRLGMEYYTAKIAPLKNAIEMYGQEAVIMTVSNNTREVKLIEYVKNLSGTCPELITKVLNQNAFNDVKRTLLSFGAVGYHEVLIKIKDIDFIRATCGHEGMIKLENWVTSRIVSRLGFEQYALARAERGQYRLIAKADKPAIESVLKNLYDCFVGTTVSSVSETISVDVALEHEWIPITNQK